MGDSFVRASGGFSKQNMEDEFLRGQNSAKVGTAENLDVLQGKTYTNSTAIGAQGAMVNRSGSPIVLNARNATATLEAGYYNSNVISVVSPQSTKTLSASQTGVTDLTPYDYKNVDASAVYSAGVTTGTAAGRTDIITNWKSHIGFTFDSTDSQNVKLEKNKWVTIFSDLGYGLYHNHIAIIAVATSDKDHGAIPYVDCMATGVGCSPIALKTTGRNHDNVRVEQDIFIYKLQAGAYEIKVGNPDYDVEASIQVWITSFS